ncbi:hypothetical protein LBMAG21_14590 [Armatimonadota bacterium]|nr:hypothetical protein LBMAG21_14590 [Armatimonadota bacterium]
MKNRLAFLVGFLALATLLIAREGWVYGGGIAPRQVAEGSESHGITSAPKQIADGQETHGFKPAAQPKNA